MADRDKILRAILAESLYIKDPKAREVFKRAAVQTGLVESGLTNPSGGDADSAGWRQERASLYPNPTNIAASAKRFRKEFQQHYDRGELSYEVAAQVQRPAAQYRGRYREVAPKAAAILQGYKDSAGVDPYVPARGASVASGGADRRALLAQYLLQRDSPDALPALVAGVRGLDDNGGSSRPSPSTPASPKASGSGGSELLELFWQGPGGINVKHGRKVPQGFVSGHTDHVHVAAGPKTTVALGKLAQSMGLHVGENPHFGGVAPVHVQGSYHYRPGGQAIDVSGDPKQMAAFARAVASRYGIK